MAKYSNSLVLILDEWMLLKRAEAEQKNSFELFYRRRKKSSAIFCFQYGFKEWYDQFGGEDSSLAYTIIDTEHDRLMREVYGLDKISRQ